MPEILGATITAIAADDCAAVIAWVAGRAAQPADVGDPEWALAQCDDGVVWGHRRTPDRSWLLSCTVFPDLAASLTPKRLQELRLFGPDQEILIWPCQAVLQGRCLEDRARPGGWGACEPLGDTRVLIGDRWQHREQGFTLVADAAGSRQAVPLDCPAAAFDQPARTGGARPTWPLRLHLRHYLDCDRTTGAVRVAASRLVTVTCEGGAD